MMDYHNDIFDQLRCDPGSKCYAYEGRGIVWYGKFSKQWMCAISSKVYGPFRRKRDAKAFLFEKTDHIHD